MEPEGEAWLSTIIPMAAVHQLLYIPPPIGQWFLSTATNQFNCDSDKVYHTELADCGAS